MLKLKKLFALISFWIEGKYLGLGGGGCYASSKIDFEKDTKNGFVGNGELSFFPGVARGSVSPSSDNQKGIQGSISICNQFLEVNSFKKKRQKSL